MGFDMNEINLVKFQDRKWNFPSRKLNYFSHFQASDQRTYFYKTFVIWFKVFNINFQNRK